MWDLNTLKRLNHERAEYLRAKRLKEEESTFKEIDVYEDGVDMSGLKKDRDYVFRHVPVHMQDKGAYDEGYYYNYCYDCEKKTEHENEVCCLCNAHNPD
tara:strand:- start:1463 stop:1759 length:297 start_codon:yes stop_codon:yes gene_type:complete